MHRYAPKFFLLLVLGGLAGEGCRTISRGSGDANVEVRAALEQQVREWNAGNLAGFMEVYSKSDHTRFASGGNVFLGWHTVFDRYRSKYADRAAMGELTFSDLEVTEIAPDAALAFGRWRLKREKDEPSGLFTLLFRKTPDGWRVVHDHTSSAETK